MPDFSDLNNEKKISTIILKCVWLVKCTCFMVSEKQKEEQHHTKHVISQ